MSQTNIVMYHYVRPIKGSLYPKIKGLELDGFKRQLDYLSERFKFITAEEVINVVKNGKSLPKNSCWLTFDDGYKDHFSYVLPELLKRGIQGSFFPPVMPIMENKMLNVNSIHFILANASSIDKLICDLNKECLDLGHSEEEIRNLWDEYAIPSRYDPKEVIYFKRLLQHALPDSSSNKITSRLFSKYVGINQTDFAQNLYMSPSEVRALVKAGMYVGSHGANHLWLSKEEKYSQKKEINKSLEFLSSMGARTFDWIMCYPYGDYNKDTIDLLIKSDCAVGLTIKVAKADLKVHHPLELPRFDTNNFPH